MAIKVLTLSNTSGVKKDVLPVATADLPVEVASAVSTASNKVLVTFNTSVVYESLLDPANYSIVDDYTHERLYVLRVEWVSSVSVTLITSTQSNVTYTVTAGHIHSQYSGEPVVAGSNDSASFSGTEDTDEYDTGSRLQIFYGLEAGMQANEELDFGPDVYAPVIQNQIPFPNETGVAVDTNVSFEVVDVRNGIDASSTIIYFNGVVVWTSDTSVEPTLPVNKSVVADGYSYSINPTADLAQFEIQTVRVVCKDNAPIPNTLDTEYEFKTQDIVAPYLDNQVPPPGSTEISPISHISLSVLDTGSGVVESSVTITIGSDIAWSAGALQSGFTGSETSVPGGYAYDFQKNTILPPGAALTVMVNADDVADNALSTSYSFDVAADAPPTIDNLVPRNNATGLPTTQNISFDVTDDIELDASKTVLRVNDLVVYSNNVARYGYIVTKSAITFGYHYEATPPNEWAYSEDVQVSVFAEDALGSASTREWSFRIEKDPACFTGPLTTVEEDLLTPVPSLPNTEKLRTLLLAYSTEQQDSNTAARILYLRAYRFELWPVLAKLIPHPTQRILDSKLCEMRPVIEVSDNLRAVPYLLLDTIKEIESLGLPLEHSKMLRAYAKEDQPNTDVPLGCLLVLLAKALG